MAVQSQSAFKAIIAEITAQLADRAVDAGLQSALNQKFPAGGPVVDSVFAACKKAIAEGWMCGREAGGIRYGRVIKPDPELAGYSVDVVEMQDLAGPHHRHPHGEIDLIMPLTVGATFDGHPAGWLVYGPGTAHHPTVANGRALILYLLPHGAIEFTK